MLIFSPAGSEHPSAIVPDFPKALPLCTKLLRFPSSWSFGLRHGVLPVVNPAADLSIAAIVILRRPAEERARMSFYP